MKQATAALFLLALLFTLAGCVTSSNLPRVDAVVDKPVSRPQDRYSNFLEIGEFYYYLYNEKVFFSPKGEPLFYYLCNRPNCTHGGTDCNAYAGCTLGYWNGYLYGVIDDENQDMIVVQMNMDGSAHRRIAKIELPIGDDGGEGGGYFFSFHENYLFYYVAAYPCAFYRVDLSTGKTERLFQKLLRGEADISFPVDFDGGAMVFLYRDSDWKNWLYRYQEAAKAPECLREWPLDVKQGWEYYDGKICYYAGESGAIFTYDYLSGELEKHGSYSYYGGAVYYDTDNIYFVNWDDASFSNMGIAVLDKDYNILEEVEFPYGIDYGFATDDFLFFVSKSGYPISYYLPKSAIGTGEAELLPIEDPYSYR